MKREEMTEVFHHFMDTLKSNTSVFYVGHGQHWIADCCMVEFDVFPEGYDYAGISNTISIKCILSGEKRKGNGTKVMNLLCEAADAIGIDLSLYPKPLGSDADRLRKAELVKWYKKFGFKTINGKMRRISKNKML